MHLGQTQLVLEKKRDKFNETYLQVTAEDVPHDAHVVLNVVNGKSVHAQELGEQGLPVSLHNVRVILLRQILNQLSWIYSMCINMVSSRLFGAGIG